MSFATSANKRSAYVCVSGGRDWRGVAGQLEHRLVKKSIKEKQRMGWGGLLFLLAAVFACKAASSLTEWVQGLFIAKAWLSEGKEVWVQDYDFLFCGIQHQTQLSQFTISHLLSNLLQSSWGKSLWVFSNCLTVQVFKLYGSGDNLKQTHTLVVEAVCTAL